MALFNLKFLCNRYRCMSSDIDVSERENVGRCRQKWFTSQEKRFTPARQ